MNKRIAKKINKAPYKYNLCQIRMALKGLRSPDWENNLAGIVNSPVLKGIYLIRAQMDREGMQRLSIS